MQEIKKIMRVLAVHVINPRRDKEEVLAISEELESLIHTLGGEVIDRVIQKMDRPDVNTYVGSGKVAEVEQKVQEAAVNVVVLNAMAKPGQVHNLKSALRHVNPNIEVWDRVDLILHIFDKHAKTTEAKLQIELARMRYMGPRIYGMGFILSRQGGGIGTSGIGETNTELMKRHWRNEMKKVTDQLDKIGDSRMRQLQQRKKSGFKTVSIVGYTNAGKSSLFNTLTHKGVLEENVLFATLDSSIGKLYIPELREEILLTDTIGFIRNLPPRLIQAFKSTLMESIHADVLLHVIDVSDPEFITKIQVVNDIFIDLGCGLQNMIYVFNKIDAATYDETQLRENYKEFHPMFISVKTGKGVENISPVIAQKLKDISSALPINALR